jgi:hypothetical protein
MQSTHSAETMATRGARRSSGRLRRVDAPGSGRQAAAHKLINLYPCLFIKWLTHSFWIIQVDGRSLFAEMSGKRLSLNDVCRAPSVLLLKEGIPTNTLRWDGPK